MTELFDTSIDITYNAIVHGHNNHTTNWMLLKCDNSLRLIAYGVNGFSECRTELKEQVPLYGFIRIKDIYLFLDWQPSSVENEALNEHKNVYQALLEKFTSDDYTLFQLTASDLEELNDDMIDQLLSQHHPHRNYEDYDHGLSDGNDTTSDDDTYEQAIDDEKLRLQKEEEDRKKLEEEEKLKKEELEKQRLQKLKQLEEDRMKMKQDMIDANNNGDVLINGFISVKSHNNPFWKRRCIQIEDKTIKISSEEKPKNQLKSIPLANIKRYGKCDIDRDCYITNAAVLETADNEVWQFLADDQNELYKVLMAIEICTS
ncbi:unnamed protein product [Cunninghamella blakesleeana]